MKSITLTNNTALDIALDIKLSEDRAIRDTLPAAGTLALGSLASREELERDAGFSSLLDAGTVEMTFADSENVFPMEMLRINLPAGTSATQDDTNVFPQSTAPYDFRLVDTMLLVDTAGAGGSTVELRDTAAGAGSAYTSALSTAATGRVLDASTTAAVVSRGDTILIDRSDGDAVGEIILTIQRLG